MSDLREQGVAAAKAGQRDEARVLLARALQQDVTDEQAWLWLAGVLDAPADIQRCLNSVLALNPHNAQAQQGVRWLASRAEMLIDDVHSPAEPALVSTPPIIPTPEKRPIAADEPPILPHAQEPAPTPYVPEMPFATPEAIEQPIAVAAVSVLRRANIYDARTLSKVR